MLCRLYSEYTGLVTVCCVTNWGRVTHICVTKLGHHLFRKWFVPCLVSSHLLNQYVEYGRRTACTSTRWVLQDRNDTWYSDDPSMDELHAKLGICDLTILVRERRLRWFGHVMRSNGEINRVRSRPVPGRKGPGRPKKTWEECVKQDLKVCGLSEAGTQDRLSWRSSVKNSRQEPTPSNGSLLQSMAAPPARRVLGMRTRSFNKTGFDWLIDLIDIQMSTNVVMPHPNDALLRHDDYLIVTSYEYCAGTWRHRQVGGPPEKSNGGKNY